jgi:hypothetical protein
MPADLKDYSGTHSFPERGGNAAYFPFMVKLHFPRIEKNLAISEFLWILIIVKYSLPPFASLLQPKDSPRSLNPNRNIYILTLVIVTCDFHAWAT